MLLLSLASAWAPAFSRILAASALPYVVSVMSEVNPLSSWAFTSAPWSTSNFIVPTCYAQSPEFECASGG
jgi:hypothetical protein